MDIINNKQKAIQELRRISQRSTSSNNKKITSTVEKKEKGVVMISSPGLIPNAIKEISNA